MIGYVFYTHRYKLSLQGWILSSELILHSFSWILLVFLSGPILIFRPSSVTLFLTVSSLTVKCVTGLSPDFLYKSLGLYPILSSDLRLPALLKAR